MKFLTYFFVLLQWAILGTFNTAWSFESEAKYAILVDLDSEQVLYSKNAVTRMHPSSMTKIMVAYITFDHIKQGLIAPETKLKISHNARSMTGSRMFLEQGSSVSVEDLLNGLLTQSGNDAAVALAEGIAGSHDKFVTMMNDYAAKLDMNSTHFVNATGLSDPEHLTTMLDLYTLSRAVILDFPEYYSLFGVKHFKHNNILQYNRNKAIGKMGVDGIKTGHTDAGGYGVALSAHDDEQSRRVIAIINGCESEAARLRASLDIIDYGINQLQVVTILPSDIDGSQLTEQGDYSIPVHYGAAKSLNLKPKKEVAVYLPKTALDDYVVEMQHFSHAVAPVRAGDDLGRMVVRNKAGDELTTVALVAAHDVKRANFIVRAWQSLGYLWSRIAG